MTHTFRTSATLSISDGSERDYDLVIAYDVTPGSPETGLGQPDPDLSDAGSPDELRIEQVRAYSTDGGAVEDWAASKLLTLIARNDETLEEAILAAWRSSLTPDPDAQREVREDGRVSRG